MNDSSLQAGNMDAKHTVRNKTEYKTAVGRSGRGGKYTGMYKNIVEIPESMLTFLWHMPCLGGGWHKVGNRRN